jgi:hypothetical protein
MVPSAGHSRPIWQGSGMGVRRQVGAEYQVLWRTQMDEKDFKKTPAGLG